MPRPRFSPTPDQRKMVEAMAGYGIREADIARTLGDEGIDPKTLRRYFRKELDTGAIKANVGVAQSLYKLATSGKSPAAAIFWLKCRAGWKETTTLEHTGPEGGPLEIVHGNLDQRITDELARLSAHRRSEGLSGPVHRTGEGGAAIPMERVASTTEPTGSGG